LSRIPPEVEPPSPPARRLGVARWVLFVLALSLACGACGESSDAAGLADDLAPHEEAISRLVQWAERTTRSARPGERARARLDETLFSPVRSEPRFHVVVVETIGRSPLHATHPPDAEVPSLAWRSIRTRTLGTLEAARDPHDATRVWARIERDALRVVVAVGPPAPPAS
jgi:hypothetical protein